MTTIRLAAPVTCAIVGGQPFAPNPDLLPAITDVYYWEPRSAATTSRINHPAVPAGFAQAP